MGFCFSKPDKKELLAESRERIDGNARVLEVCKEIADGDIKTAVERVYNAVRYMTPTDKAGAAQADKKINALAGDLKIALTKDSDRGRVQAEEIVKDLGLAVAERNSYVK